MACSIPACSALMQVQKAGVQVHGPCMGMDERRHRLQDDEEPKQRETVQAVWHGRFRQCGHSRIMEATADIMPPIRNARILPGFA